MYTTLLDGDLALQGSLGSLSLSDLTPHGDLYRERFTTHGGEALVYDIHKYFLFSSILCILHTGPHFHIFCVHNLILTLPLSPGMANLTPVCSGNMI